MKQFICLGDNRPIDATSACASTSSNKVHLGCIMYTKCDHDRCHGLLELIDTSTSFKCVSGHS